MPDPALNPARNPGEDVDAYKRRRIGVKRALKKHSKGKDIREVKFNFTTHENGDLTIRGQLQVGKTIRQHMISLNAHDNHASAITMAKKRIRHRLLNKPVHT